VRYYALCRMWRVAFCFCMGPPSSGPCLSQPSMWLWDRGDVVCSSWFAEVQERKHYTSFVEECKRQVSVRVKGRTVKHSFVGVHVRICLRSFLAWPCDFLLSPPGNTWVVMLAVLIVGGMNRQTLFLLVRMCWVCCISSRRLAPSMYGLSTRGMCACPYTWLALLAERMALRGSIALAFG
jgi:hypothetical protein